MYEYENEDSRQKYEMLNAIDGKSASILSFNALILAGISIWLTQIPQNYFHLVLDIIFLSILYSCYKILDTTILFWKGHSPGAEQPDEGTLEGKVTGRTISVNSAQWISKASIVVVMLLCAIHTFDTLLRATNSCPNWCEVYFGHEYLGTEKPPH